MTPTELLQIAKELVIKYDEINSALEKWLEMTDEMIDEILWAESESNNMLHALLLAKKIQAERRKIAEKEESKIMAMINRIMVRSRQNNYECEDGKIKSAVVYRFNIVDESEIPQELKAPVWQKVNSLIQKWESVPWVEKLDGYLSSRVW